MPASAASIGPSAYMQNAARRTLLTNLTNVFAHTLGWPTPDTRDETQARFRDLTDQWEADVTLLLPHVTTLLEA
eukprot:16088574-Heterocapsa_arctica.AAC.1